MREGYEGVYVRPTYVLRLVLVQYKSEMQPTNIWAEKKRKDRAD